MKSLIKYLKKAESKLSNYTGGYSGEILSAEEFHSKLVQSISKLEKGDDSVLDELWLWFAPTCAWDDFVGDIELGELIWNKLDKLKKEKAGNNR